MKVIVIMLVTMTALAFSDSAPNINYVDLDGKRHNMNTYIKQGKYLAYDFVTLD